MRTIVVLLAAIAAAPPQTPGPPALKAAVTSPRLDLQTRLDRAGFSPGEIDDPLPLGDWKVTGVQRNPIFHYNPDLFWDADPSHAEAKIPAGPNNPVGLVWVDLSRPHYGLHGTPEPSNIGRTESHGFVRLTNWDALHLAALVAPGTPVLFRP